MEVNKQTNKKKNELNDEDSKCSQAKGKRKCAVYKDVCLCLFLKMCMKACMCFNLNGIIVILPAVSEIEERYSSASLVMRFGR